MLFKRWCTLTNLLQLSVHRRVMLLITNKYEQRVQFKPTYPRSMVIDTWANMSCTQIATAYNTQGGPLCKRGGCVRTLRTAPGLHSECAFSLHIIEVCLLVEVKKHQICQPCHPAVLLRLRCICFLKNYMA